MADGDEFADADASFEQQEEVEPEWVTIRPVVLAFEGTIERRKAKTRSALVVSIH